MANPEHLAILKQGVKAWNEWRSGNFEVRPDLHWAEIPKADLALVNFEKVDLRGANLLKVNLSSAKLSMADLRGASLVGSDLRLADLRLAKLSRADLSSADLRQATLSSGVFRRTNLHEVNLGRANLYRAELHGADLGLANLRDADLSEAFLIKANLISANISSTKLQSTDLSNAKIGWTVLGDLDLRSVRGLETVKHEGPSPVGIDTIYRSEGKIPEVFLRGCGIPEDFIAYARSLGEAIQFYSCFISHSSKDKQFCERLYADLQVNAVRVWYFPEDAKWGEPVWGEIDRSIKIYDKLVVVCSKNSLTSGPVLREIERALSREDKELKNVLFPITIDRYLFDEWEHPRKQDVLAKVVGTDFIGWNRSAAKYDAAFKKLLKALKAE